MTTHRHWPEFGRSPLRTFRTAHAVSTYLLARGYLLAQRERVVQHQAFADAIFVQRRLESPGADVSAVLTAAGGGFTAFSTYAVEVQQLVADRHAAYARWRGTRDGPGATALRGVEGYGASNLIRTNWLLSMSDELLMIVAIDTQVWVDASLPQLDELVREGLVVLDECEVVRYVGRDPEDSAEP